MPRKWIGSAITAITLVYFLTDKERYNTFGMGIIEEIRFFFFDVEDLARSQTMCRNDAKKKKKKNKVCGLRRKRG